MRTRCEPPHHVHTPAPTNPPRGCLARRLFVRDHGPIDTWEVDYEDDQATWRLVEAPVTELPDWEAAAADHATSSLVGWIVLRIFLGCCGLGFCLKCIECWMRLCCKKYWICLCKEDEEERPRSHQTRVRKIVRQASGGRFCACSSTTSSSTTGTSLNPAPNPSPTIVAGERAAVVGQLQAESRPELQEDLVHEYWNL